MFMVEDKKYHETLDILRGKMQLSPLYIELKEWLKSEYGITAYNFEFGKMKYDKLNRFRLFILLSSEKDYYSMLKGYYNFDAIKQVKIATKFYELAQKYKQRELCKANKIFVSYTDFTKEMIADYNSKVSNKIGKTLKKKYADHSVWSIVSSFGSLVVFYNSDNDIKINLENGISKQIKNEYCDALHQVDEFNIFADNSVEIIFDSKENVDKKYAGSLFYYFR